MIRLDKLLADAGTGTRSQVKEYIRRGQVMVNGAVCKKPEQKVAEEDLVCLNGQMVGYARFRYYMLHKPQGWLPPQRIPGIGRCWICSLV